MASTPPPASRRPHTPPAPLHGPRYDAYEPYSPRRSSRVAAQREHHYQQTQLSSDNSPSSRRVRAATPSGSRQFTARKSSNAFSSPPSSPVSPVKHRSVRATRQPQLGIGLDSDSDQPSSRPQHLSAIESRMLLTPAKTPRKRALPTHETPGSTARVLFTSRTATVEDAMPTPRKSRNRRKHAISLESFAEIVGDDDDDGIQIYTDSNARVPTINEHEDNPFLTRTRATNGRSTAGPSASRRRKQDPKAEEMEQAAANDEGMIYVFRGRKIFRKFHDGPPSNASSDGPDHSADELRRLAGPTHSGRVTRSSIKPRLLWPNEHQRQEREMGPDDVDEEAVTDIEVPVMSTPRKQRSEKIVTPVKQNFSPATPPSTVRGRRTKRDVLSLEVPDVPHLSAEESDGPPASHTRARTNPFQSWARVKSRSSQGSKRSGSPMESAPKRTRNGRPAAGA